MKREVPHTWYIITFNKFTNIIKYLSLTLNRSLFINDSHQITLTLILVKHQAQYKPFHASIFFSAFVIKLYKV